MESEQKRQTLEFLRSEEGNIPFGSKGQLGEAYKAVKPILEAWETADTDKLPPRMSRTFRAQMAQELQTLKENGLHRIVRITDASLASAGSNGGLGFSVTTDASREWRECEIYATVLEQYVDDGGKVVMENFDTSALLTVRQSRHIRMSDKKGWQKKEEYYQNLSFNCPSCGAEVEHIADKTACPYCGAELRFWFFDWQLESFSLDIHKGVLLSNSTEIAEEAAVKSVKGLVWIVDQFADSFARVDEKADKVGRETMNYQLGAWITVIAFVLILVVIGFCLLPYVLRVALAMILAGLVLWGLFKFVKNQLYRRKINSIVRYSESELRSCLYEIFWARVEKEKLIDFSLDGIFINNVKHTEGTTALDIETTLLTKRLGEDGSLRVEAQTVPMTVQRARHPERRRKKKTFEEKECPSCGANFQPDDHGNCVYCGYGLKLENYIWRAV